LIPDHPKPASLQSIKELLRRFVLERAGHGHVRLEHELAELYGLVVAEAAKRGISAVELMERHRDSTSGGTRDEE
jgi:hypothetical protein